MIPKTIHYCWFGKVGLPPLMKKCIASWEIYCPDYEIVEWNESNFDTNTILWTKEAYKVGKYAFVADYARLHVLYKYGGIYLDTDMELLKNLDKFLSQQAFCGFENECLVQTGLMGFVSEHELIKAFLDYYDGRHFINTDGSIDDMPNVCILTKLLKTSGFKTNNEFQVVKGLAIYPRTYFCPIDADGNREFSKKTHSIHHFTSTWRTEKEQREVVFMHKWYYPAYKSTFNKAIKIAKNIFGQDNTSKLRKYFIKE